MAGRALPGVLLGPGWGGAYVVRDYRAGAVPKTRAGDGPRSVGALLKGVAKHDHRRFADIEPWPRHDRERLAASIGSVVWSGQHVWVTATQTVLPKLRHDEVDIMLRERGETAGRVLRTLEPVELPSRCTLRHSTGQRGAGMPETYDVPELSLREYHDVICAPEQVVIQHGAILPDSYRHNMQRRLKNMALPEVAPRFARAREDLSPRAELAGAYYYLDNEHRGHFGHALTEQVSMFWGWAEAQQRRPDIKALVALNRRREVAEWEYTLLAANGIRPEDVVMIRQPVQVETLVAATPMLSMPAYVHPDIDLTWQRIGAALASQAPPRDYPDNIFCSRRIKKRACRNTDEVEHVFAQRGFDIVFTEDFPLAEQAAMFRHADAIAGFAGSAMFNLAWCDAPKHVVLVQSESYTARNEYMIAAVQGHSLDVVACKPDIEQPKNSWRKQAFDSTYAFDLDRDSHSLDRFLGTLR